MEFAHAIAVCLIVTCDAGSTARSRIEAPPEPFEPEAWQSVEPMTGSALNRYGLERSDRFAPLLRELFGWERPARR